MSSHGGNNEHESRHAAAGGLAAIRLSPAMIVAAVIGVLIAASVATGLALTSGGSGDHPAAAAPAPHTSSHSSAPASAVGSASSSPAADQSSATAAGTATTAPASKAVSKNTTLTYTVKPGDNLTAIAKWFHLHGYQPLYGWNKTKIGSNPNLIYPGTKIIVSTKGMSVKKGHSDKS